MTAQMPALVQPAAVPLLALVASAICVLLLDLGRAPRRAMAALSLTGLTTAAAMALIIVTSGQGGTIQGMLNLDGSSALFILLFCGAGIASILLEQGLPEAVGMQDGGGYALLLLAIAGSTTVAQSGHWLPSFVGLAMLHICIAAWVGARAIWLYVLVQGQSQALMLFGMAVLYGAWGTLQTGSSPGTAAASALGTANPLAALGIGLVIAGLCITMAIAPFHIWLRQVCRGAWVPAGPMLSLVLPATVVAILTHAGRFWTAASDLLALLGSISVILGYTDALRSRSILDMIAGATLAQSGCLLLAWTAAADPGRLPPFFLMCSSGLAMVCLWALAALTQPEPDRKALMDDFAGLGRHSPWIGAAATLALLSLSALPPLAGSIALLASLRPATTRYGWAVGMVLAGIFMAWMLTGRWMWILWMRPPTGTWRARAGPEPMLLAVLSAGGLVLAGIWGEMLMGWIADLIALV